MRYRLSIRTRAIAATGLALLAAGTAFGGAAPATAPPGVIVAGERGGKLDRWLSAAEFKGAVLVAQGGEVLLRKGYGMADREQGVPYGTDTVSTIGSITKQFTAAAILKLEAQGKLGVQDPIGKYLPGVPDDKRAITLHHLLTHTSGLESDFAGDFEPVGRDEYVRRTLSSKLAAAPGAAYAYANSGYSLLGAIVEIVSGQPYEAYLHHNLFVPAGMLDTGYLLPRWDTRRVAVGYRNGERWGRVNEKPWADDGPYWALRANGGILSTPDDLLRWHVALEGEAVLPRAAREKLFARHVREGAGDTYYGYGWSIGDAPWGGRRIAHNGGNGVFYADFLRFVDDGLVVILLTNDSTVRGGRIADALARLAHGDDVPPPRPAQAARALAATGRDAVIRAWLDAFNAPDLEEMRAFRQKHTAPHPGLNDAERERRLTGMRDDLGRLEFEGVTGESDDEITVRTRSVRGVVTLQFMFRQDGLLDGIAVEVGE